MASDAPDNDESQKSQNDNIAGDDYGIRNDQILDLCEFIVRKLWEKVYIADSTRSGEHPRANDLSLTELAGIASTIETVWRLTYDMLDIDNKIKMMLELEDDMQEEIERLSEELDKKNDEGDNPPDAEEDQDEEDTNGKE